jgi:hypothetical protein
MSPVNRPSYLSVRLEKRKTPRGLNSASLDVSKTADLTNISYEPKPPLNVETSVIKRTLTTPGKPAKPKLQFILQNSKGGLDHDRPISRNVFQAYNICDFFKLACSRAGKSDGSVACLTFRYNWGERDAFVVVRNNGMVARELPLGPAR